MPLTAPLRIGTADPAAFSRTFRVVEATSAQVDDTGSSRDFHPGEEEAASEWFRLERMGASVWGHT
jgi:hypothetical protein